LQESEDHSRFSGITRRFWIKLGSRFTGNALDEIAWDGPTLPRAQAAGAVMDCGSKRAGRRTKPKAPHRYPSPAYSFLATRFMASSGSLRWKPQQWLNSTRPHPRADSSPRTHLAPFPPLTVASREARTCQGPSARMAGWLSIGDPQDATRPQVGTHRHR